MVEELIDVYQIQRANSDCYIQNKICCEPPMKFPINSARTVGCSCAYFHFFLLCYWNFGIANLSGNPREKKGNAILSWRGVCRIQDPLGHKHHP